METKPYMVSQVIKFSDGTETVIRYKKNGDVELSELDPVDEVMGVESKVEEAEVTVSEEPIEVTSEEII